MTDKKTPTSSKCILRIMPERVLTANSCGRLVCAETTVVAVVSTTTTVCSFCFGRPTADSDCSILFHLPDFVISFSKTDIKEITRFNVGKTKTNAIHKLRNVHGQVLNTVWDSGSSWCGEYLD